MKALTFREITDTVDAICHEVDNHYDEDTCVDDAIAECCHDYFIYHSDVWSAAAGMRFEFYDAWFDAEQMLEGCAVDWTMDEYLFYIVHECLRQLVTDAHESGAHKGV